jgi:RNA polymerase sigma-70 factor (sigma-E family)
MMESEGRLNGRPTDFEGFYTSEHDRIRRTVALAIGDVDRAADVTQEAFAVAYRRWRTVRLMERPAAYVTVIAVNRARKALRRESRSPRIMVGRPVGDGGSAPDPAVEITRDLGLRRAIAELAPRQRAAIVLRYLDDLTVADVARAMGCTEGTVKATIHQALGRLRVQLDPTDGAAEPMPRNQSSETRDARD